MYVSREAYNDMKFSGMYMHRADGEGAPLEYVHPFGRVLIYPRDNVDADTPIEMYAEWTEPRRQEAIDHANHGFPEPTDMAGPPEDGPEDAPVDGEFHWGEPRDENERNPLMLRVEPRGLIQFVNEHGARDNREFTWHTDEIRPTDQWITETTNALRNYNRTTPPYFHITGTGVAT
jgi:hypothetical protein